VAQETSEQGAQHAHFELYTPHSWRLLYAVAADPGRNERYGEYLDSLITTAHAPAGRLGARDAAGGGRGRAGLARSG
jgi:hypothetical protein